MPPLPPNAAQIRSKEENVPSIDWEGLRKLSLEPGGFGEQRVAIWPKLLHVEMASTVTHENSSATPHADERQIRLDTDRSFVLYPAEDEQDDRSHLQNALYDLIVSVFHKYPGLNYFQGYHDIVTVFFLTLPPDVQLPAVEKMSLHRLRDAMGKTLEPLMGMLRILQRLLRLVDAEFAGILEEQMPVPYAALSHILTLFAHDVPTLALVQHVFDYILARPPIAVVYLAAAIMLTHRDEIILLEREGEEGMIHSVLTSLPSFVDGPESDTLVKSSTTEKLPETHTLDAQPEDDAELDWLSNADIPYPGEDHIPRPVIITPEPDSLDTHSNTANAESQTYLSPTEVPLPPSRPPTPPPSPPPPRRPPQSLPALLSRADDLMVTYPPSNPDLKLEETLGPASVVRTWSEDPSKLPSDAAAEQMVVAAVDIVYPDEPEPAPEPQVHSDNEKYTRRRGEEKERRRRRKLQKNKQQLFGGLIVVERRTMLAGAALVLGIAMAASVYGNSRGGGAHGRAGIAGLAGAGERLWSAFSGGRGFGF